MAGAPGEAGSPRRRHLPGCPASPCPLTPGHGCPSGLSHPSRCSGSQIHDKEVLRLLYEEAKGNVLTARYPCDVEDCEALGALVCRVQLGPYQPGQPAACALR